ncbi:MAG: NAD-dependent epimerase/dehydratase family protein [Candidatus Korobacteraceae bacterium]
MKRVLITGASGLVGSRLCEVMHLGELAAPRAFIHSTGSAARIARYPLDFAIGDLCSLETVRKAMDGCDTVVHLARGSSNVMTRGLENVLSVAVEQKVRRLVHVSSVAVYGNNPPPESAHENAAANPGDNAYGRSKLTQDERVLHYTHKHGLPAVILRPPNITGPFAAFTLNLIHRLRARTLPLMDGGHNPCNLVYVDNLVQAILLSLVRDEAVGETFFITDPEVVTWEQCLRDHARLVGAELWSMESQDLPPKPIKRMMRDSVRAIPGAIFSKDFRSALRRIPLLEAAEASIFQRFESLSSEKQDELRLRLRGPEAPVVRTNGRPKVDPADGLIAGQLRKVAHSCEKAQRLLGYSAPVSYSEGMDLTAKWLKYARML